MTTTTSPTTDHPIPDKPRDARWHTCPGHRWIKGTLGGIFLLPVRVQYRFRDEQGRRHVATQWVGTRSDLGRHLLEFQPPELPVVHDVDDPSLSRLVTAQDFLTGAGA